MCTSEKKTSLGCSNYNYFFNSTDLKSMNLKPIVCSWPCLSSFSPIAHQYNHTLPFFFISLSLYLLAKPPLYQCRAPPSPHACTCAAGSIWDRSPTPSAWWHSKFMLKELLSLPYAHNTDMQSHNISVVHSFSLPGDILNLAHAPAPPSRPVHTWLQILLRKC